MLQGNGNIKDLISLLPQDVQALVLLHNGDSNSNFTSMYFFYHLFLKSDETLYSRMEIFKVVMYSNDLLE